MTTNIQFKSFKNNFTKNINNTNKVYKNFETFTQNRKLKMDSLIKFQQILNIMMIVNIQIVCLIKPNKLWILYFMTSMKIYKTCFIKKNTLKSPKKFNSKF